MESASVVLVMESVSVALGWESVVALGLESVVALGLELVVFSKGDFSL